MGWTMRWLSPDFVSKRLSFSRRTIYEWVEAGRVFKTGEVTKINRQLRISEAAVTRLITEGQADFQRGRLKK